MIAKSWKIYGIDGHRQRASFFPSHKIDETNAGTYAENWKGESYEELNSDKTGTNDYTIVLITAATEQRCREILHAQLLDGSFECCNVGKIEELY